MKKYFLEIILVALIATGGYWGYKYWLGSGNNALSFLEMPATQPAKVKTGYTVQIKFSNPTALHGIALRGRVITNKGEEDLGEFIVKDIRIWRADGYRIISDQIEVKNFPNHITVSQKLDSGEKVLFDADIKIGKTVINSSVNSIDSSLTITIIKQ